MTNKKRKGFTIVELVIVIAVIAILAGVLIPTFASIIDKANQSSDIQAVRQMNVVLMAESVDKTLSFNNVIEIVSEAGYDTAEKRTPKSSDHGFYWHSDTNLIVLVKGTSELVYPNDNETLNQLFEDEGFTVEDEEEFKNLAVEGENSGGIKTAEELKAALEEGGEIKLGANITLDTYVSISKVVTIDLNEHTLTVADSTPADSGGDHVITILSSLTITDTGSNRGSVIFESPTDNQEAYSMCSGITVDDSNASLTLENINIVGKRAYNITNNGTLSVSNSNFNVTSGHGIYNNGTTTIDNASQFIASGTNVIPIANYGTTMTISNTNFIEAEGVTVTYRLYAPIYTETGTITLTDVNIELSIADDADPTSTDFPKPFSIYSKDSSKVIINSGTFKDSTLFCISDASITIYGGTFYNKDNKENGVEYDSLTSESKIYIGVRGITLSQTTDSNNISCWIIKKS